MLLHPVAAVQVKPARSGRTDLCMREHVFITLASIKCSAVIMDTATSLSAWISEGAEQVGVATEGVEPGASLMVLEPEDLLRKNNSDVIY